MKLDYNLDMSETSDEIIYKQKTLFRAMKQRYGSEVMLKSKEEIAKAKFIKSIIDLRDNHTERKIGEVRNFNLVGDEWKGDVAFKKSLMSEEEIEDAKLLKKRDLSIGFSYFEKKSDFPDVDYEQVGIIVDEVSSVEEGRCSYPLCGLDSKTNRKKSKEKISLNQINQIDSLQEEIQTMKQEIDELKKEKQQKEVTKMPPTDCEKRVKDMQEAYDSFRADQVKELEKVKTELKTANDKINSLTLDHKTETDSLKADLEKSNKDLDEYKKIEKDSLSKELLLISKYKEDQVKDKPLCWFKEKVETIKMSSGYNADAVDAKIIETGNLKDKKKEKPMVDLKKDGPTDMFALHDALNKPPKDGDDK